MSDTKEFQVTADAVIARVAEVCGVTTDLVQIGYGLGWWSVSVYIERKAARIYKKVLVSGGGDTLDEAAEDAVRTVRWHVNEGTHRTPHGVKDP